MPRNGYTRLVNDRKEARRAHLEKQLILLIRRLRRGTTEPPVLVPIADAKERRSARLAKNRLHRSSRPNHDVETTTA